VSKSADDILTIGTVAERTGTSVALLRAWEQRYGFPRPARSSSGHRRYSERHVEQIRQVLAHREAGLSLEAAIARLSPDEPSIFAGLRRRRPDLAPHVLGKRTMLAISRAIEDEYGATDDAPLLLAAFQEERFLRASEARYRDLARTASLTVVFADLASPPADDDGDDGSADPGGPGGPIEVALGPREPLLREWAVVSHGPRGGAVLAGRERPGQGASGDAARVFEAFWSIEPEVVRTAADIALGIARRLRPGRADALDPPLPATDPGDEGLRRATALTNRIVSYVEVG
jgi:MerR family transcriptional regulator, light-induced transcriptional regulator